MIMTTCCWIVFSLWTVGAPAVTPDVQSAETDASEPSEWGTDQVGDAWAAKVLGDPEYDRGWVQSCQDDWNDQGTSTCEVRQFSYRPGSNPVALHGGQNGGMTVMGWDREGTRLIYRVKARARTLERAKDLAKQVRLEVSKGWVRPVGPETSRGEWWSVEMKVWVPRSSDLALRTHNGPVAVRNVRGTMDIESLNGPMSLVDLGGAVYARAQNGPLHVALAGSRWDGAGLDAEARNGPLNVALPRTYSARLQTGTTNGSVDLDYRLDLPERVRGHFSITLGSGGAPVRIVADNGPFHLAER